MNAVTKQVTVPLDPKEAFDLFTSSIHEWWPVETHSIHGAESRAVFDSTRIYEVGPGGQEETWGEVVDWDPPNGFTITWHVGRPASGSSQRVRVTFTEEGDATRVVLVHDGWTEAEAAMRSNYDTGWDAVLGRFVESGNGD